MYIATYIKHSFIPMLLVTQDEEEKETWDFGPLPEQDRYEQVQKSLQINQPNTFYRKTITRLKTFENSGIQLLDPTSPMNKIYDRSYAESQMH